MREEDFGGDVFVGSPIRHSVTDDPVDLFVSAISSVAFTQSATEAKSLRNARLCAC